MRLGRLGPRESTHTHACTARSHRQTRPLRRTHPFSRERALRAGPASVSSGGRAHTRPRLVCMLPSIAHTHSLALYVPGHARARSYACSCVSGPEPQPPPHVRGGQRRLMERPGPPFARHLTQPPPHPRARPPAHAGLREQRVLLQRRR